MTRVASLLTVQVGAPKRYPLHDTRGGDERSWETSFFREPSPERRRLHTTHLDGNAQADTKNHGSPSQAVLLYTAAHYPLWGTELGRPEIGPGGLGESFVGDTYVVGEARIQVSGAHYPFVKIGRRWGIPALTRRAAETGRTGWYSRVLQEGWVKPGLPVELVDRSYPEGTVALVNDFGHDRNRDIEAARALARCPLLPEWWQCLVVLGAAGRG